MFALNLKAAILLVAATCFCYAIGADSPCAAQSSASTGPASDSQWAPPNSTNASDMLAFINQLVSREPTGETERELVEYQRKVAEGIAAAAGKGLSLGPSVDEAPPLNYYRLHALNVLQRMGDPGAMAQFEAALDAARQSSVPDVGAIGVKFLVESRMEQWPTLAKEARQEIVTGLVDYLQHTQLEANDANTIVTVADFLSMENETALANRLLETALPLFRRQKSASSADLQEWIALLEGVQRKVTLPGKKIKLSGRLLDGSQLDWSQYQGKVVLVDFWASWCTPCRAELPNIRQLYRAYHDKGFEVVGICIDATEEEAAGAIRELKIPWATLFSHDETKRKWQDPRAVEFGVTGIPTAILLDQDHRVIHMNARGEILADQLQSLLGKPLVQLDEPDPDAIQQVMVEE